MIFSAPKFLFIFLPVVLILYHTVRIPVFQNGLLILASLFFYAYGEPHYVLLMVASILVNYGCVCLLKKKTGRFPVVAAVVFNIGMLVLFKYAGLPVRLPIGISFYTFQALSLVIDVYRMQQKGAQTEVRFWDVLLYISFFPQLIAGPIVQYGDFAPYLRSRHCTPEHVAEGIRRFIFGLSKKVLLADAMAVVCDGLYLQGDTNLSGVGVWLAAICYLFQIYFDFSGYSDMAIGLGKMFGFTFRENFDLPYTASSVREFWRRWHISLSSWFREYLYIPMGGNRQGTARTVLNRMLVFACTGIWHGAGLNFLVWGLWHGTFVSVEGFLAGKEKNGFLRRLIGTVYTLLVVLVGFILFRAETFQKALRMIGAMFTDISFQSSALTGVLSYCTPYRMTVFVLCGVFASGIVPKVRRAVMARRTGVVLSYVISLILLLLCIMTVASATYSPFIYFRF